MTEHIYFLLKISADIFGNLALTLSAHLSFQSVYEFGLCTLSASQVDGGPGRPLVHVVIKGQQLSTEQETTKLFMKNQDFPPKYHKFCQKHF
jgi:hypothetical protein